MSKQSDSKESIFVSGNILTSAQVSRRRMMQGILATGGAAALANFARRGAFAQATPVASPATAATPFAGPLAADQTIKLPSGEPVTMDPGVSYGDNELDIFFNIFEGLVGVDQETGEVVPRVAESYEANADASQFTFHIREGVTWSDGTPLNANDFVYSWNRVLDPNTASQYIPALYPIKNAESIANGTPTPDPLGVTATDDYTLVVDLEGPTTFFPLLATTWTFFPVPKHVIDAKGDKWVEADNIVSNGPYVMTEWSHNQEIVLEQNAKYYGDKPTITKATYTLFQDTGTQTFTAFQNGELDYCAPEGPDVDTIVADTSGDLVIIQFELSNTYFVVCDTSTAPTDKVEFRQALYKTVDRKTLATEVYKNQYDAAFTLLPPNIPGNNPGAALDESVDEAKQLLSTAGIDPSSVKIELTYINEAPYATMVQYLQATWQKALGITVTLAPITDAAYSDWRAARATEPFNVYTATWGSDFADASNWFNQNFTHAADHYRNHWNNPDFDALVGKAINNTNLQERNQQYSDAETIIIRESPVIPVVRGKAFRVIKPWVKDIFFQPVLSEVHLRTIKIAQH
jgi:oligopeptide transport system substrate-binding protein